METVKLSEDTLSAMEAMYERFDGAGCVDVALELVERLF